MDMESTHNRISGVFSYPALVETISSKLERADVKKLKVYLHGHMNKQSLDRITNGKDLLKVLQARGLVTENKLAFLRKVLADVELIQLAGLIDGFKEDKSRLNPKLEQAKKEHTKRMEALQKLCSRQEREINNFERDKAQLRKKLEEKEALIDTQKERLVNAQDIIDNLDNKLETVDSEIMHTRDRIQENEEVIRRQTKQLRKLENSLGKTVTLKKEKITTHKSRVQNPKTKDSKEDIEPEQISEEEKEAQSKLRTIEKLKSEDKAMRQKYDTLLKERREKNSALVEKINETVSVDEHMLKTMEEMRVLKRQLKETQYNIDELRDRRDETLQDLETVKEKGVKTSLDGMVPRRNQPSPRYPQNKIVDYSNVRELDSMSIGCEGTRSNPPQFKSPCSVAINAHGHILVADHGNCCIHFLDITGKPVKEPLYLGKTHPSAVAVNKHGLIIVTDGQMIKVFCADGTLSHNFLPIYNKKDQRPYISSLTVDQNDGLYLCDQSNHRIQHFKEDGTFQAFIGSRLYINMPADIAVTKNGDLIVTEYSNHCLKILPKGKIEVSLDKGIIGREGAGIGQFKNPMGVALDQAENILVSDSENHRVQVLNAQGVYIGSFGKYGTGPGCVDTPCALVVNQYGHVIVVDSGNHRLNVYS